MAQTFLNGRISISSLAAPSEADKRALDTLSDDERKAIIAEAVERAEYSGIRELTPQDLWDNAKARALAKCSQHAV